MITNYMYAVDRSDEYLAHYGIKGMRWGVRKAKESGDRRALQKQYNKASKKLAKLEKRANNGSKYAKRAAALGAGAAAAGGLAAAGTGGVANAIRGVAAFGRKLPDKIGNISDSLAATNIDWIAGKPVDAVENLNQKIVGLKGKGYMQSLDNQANAVQKWGESPATSKKILTDTRNGEEVGKLPLSNNDLARAGAAALGLGLAGAAGYNAYRAATTKRAAKKAERFRSEMGKAFKGTEFANKVPQANTASKKRRRR